MTIFWLEHVHKFEQILQIIQPDDFHYRFFLVNKELHDPGYVFLKSDYLSSAHLNLEVKSYELELPTFGKKSILTVICLDLHLLELYFWGVDSYSILCHLDQLIFVNCSIFIQEFVGFCWASILAIVGDQVLELSLV